MSAQTPRALAARATAIVTAAVLLASAVAWYADLGDYSGIWLLPAVVTALVGFWVIYYSIEKFLYEKVKIIFKSIHRIKSGPGKKPEIDMRENVLDEVNKEVMRWAEDRVREIQSLKEKDNFRREFIGNLSHELKTPIFNIQGYILTLLDGALEDKENNRKFLLKAAKNLDRLTTLLEELDAITRIESGSLELKVQRIDIVELCRDVIEAAEHNAREKNITLRLKNTNEAPIYVLADRSRIEQVVTNLVNNSIAYGTQGGETKIRFYDMDENVLVEVADNGIGMTADHLPRVFERFYRVDKSRSRHEGGTGLGLAIAKHIIDAHEQSINVRSTEGIGSTFSFTLEKA